MRRNLSWVGVACLGLFAGSRVDAQPAPGTTPAQPASPMANPKVEWPKEIGGKDLKGWIAELKDSPDAAMREAAVKAIPMFGPPARDEALTPLLAALRKEADPGVKVNLLIVIGSIGPRSPEEGKRVVDPLKIIVSTAGSGSPYRLHAARGLGNCAEFASEAVPELATALEDSSWETRRTVAQVLGMVGRPNAKRSAPSAQALNAVSKKIRTEKSVPVRLELVQAMVSMGPPAVPANPNDYAKVIEPYYKVITEQIKDEKDKSIQVWLTVLLMLYDGSQLTESTIKKIADHVPGADANARVAALRALGLLDDKSKPFLPVMVDALKNEDPATVVEAINALAALDMHARTAIPDLEKLKAATKDEAIKAMATAAIDIIQGKKPVAPAPPAAPPPPKK
jgi:HEAT repeat protein